MPDWPACDARLVAASATPADWLALMAFMALAAVPADRAAACVAALQDAGYAVARRIGVPTEAIREALATIGLDTAFTLEQADHIRLEAEIDTPGGHRILP